MIDLDYIMYSIYFYYWLRNLNVALIGSLKLNSLYIVLVRDLVRAYRLLTELNHQLCEYTSHCFPSSQYVCYMWQADSRSLQSESRRIRLSRVVIAISSSWWGI